MSRYTATCESAAAIAQDTVFANLVAGAANQGIKVRKLRLGVIAGASPPTSQQVEVVVRRTTSRGTTPGGTVAPNAIDPAFTAFVGLGLDTTWATPPAQSGAILDRITFNSLAGYEIPLEGLDEWVCQGAASNANGILFINANNALPSSHKITLMVEVEE